MIAKCTLTLLTTAIVCLGTTAQKICGLGNYAEPCVHDQCQLMAARKTSSLSSRRPRISYSVRRVR